MIFTPSFSQLVKKLTIQDIISLTLTKFRQNDIFGQVLLHTPT